MAPDTTKEDALKAQLTAFRDALKSLVADAVTIKDGVVSSWDNGPAKNEAVANIVIAYRHLEDAAMRFGKAIQAVDGGVSPLGGPRSPGQ